jgi:DNA-binding LacI/PurR family transcriptional regulator
VMGRRMGEIILELYDNPDLPARRELLKTELMVRESTAPC